MARSSAADSLCADPTSPSGTFDPCRWSTSSHGHHERRRWGHQRHDGCRSGLPGAPAAPQRQPPCASAPAGVLPGAPRRLNDSHRVLRPPPQRAAKATRGEAPDAQVSGFEVRSSRFEVRGRGRGRDRGRDRARGSRSRSSARFEVEIEREVRGRAPPYRTAPPAQSSWMSQSGMSGERCPWLTTQSWCAARVAPTCSW